MALVVVTYGRTKVRGLQRLQRVRLTAVAAAPTVDGVFNLARPMGDYGRVSRRYGNLQFAYSSYGTPPFLQETQVPATADATEGRFAWDVLGRIHLIYTRAGSVCERISDDDGLTWNAETTCFTGSHGDISLGRDGLLLRAAYVAGALSITRQYPGDAAAGSAFNAKNSAGADLALADDSFRLVSDHRGVWWLHVRLSAAANTTLHYSWDDGATWTPADGGVSGIATATHPGMAIGYDGTLRAWAYAAGVGKVTYRDPGDTAWQSAVTMKDSAGSSLALQDAAFSYATAWERPGRLVLAAMLSGEASASDHWSLDEGASNRRFT